jgi:hypothetical protein
MSEHGSTSPRFGRRALSAVAVLSIAATGAAWSGCGDDNEDEASSSASSIAEQANSTAQSISEGAQQQADEAQDQANQAIDEAQGQTPDTQGQGGGYGGN